VGVGRKQVTYYFFIPGFLFVEVEVLVRESDAAEYGSAAAGVFPEEPVLESFDLSAANVG